jgi:hypothetical protein
MAKTRRTLMTAAVALILCCGGRALAAEGEALTIVLHVRDYAHLSPSDLKGAENEATRIYKAAHITVVWMNPGAVAGDAYAGAVHLTVLFLDREMAQRTIETDRIGPNVLGLAAHATGRAHLFCHRIVAAAETYPQDFSVVLGRVLAHEVGHMVLPAYSHSESGIMRAVLDRSTAPQRFSREQIATIRTTVAADLRAAR